MGDENICILCKAEFKEGALNEDKKCEMCEKLWPGITSKEDLKKDPDEEKNEGRLRTVIEKTVEDILVKHGILHKCECGKSFYKRSPAQKICSDCKGDK